MSHQTFKRVGRRALIALLWAAASVQAWAACADGAAPREDMRLHHGGHSFRAELCLLQGPHQDVRDLGQGLMQLNWFEQGPRHRVVAPEPGLPRARAIETCR